MDPREVRGISGFLLSNSQLKKTFPIKTVLSKIRKHVQQYKDTALTQVNHSGQPFRLLIGCLLSLRTKDETTYPASERLFHLADTPRMMLKLTERQIQKAIYPVGFYRTKAKNIRKICRILIDEHQGQVSADRSDLMALPGVGLKTANLVLGLGFQIPAICVDIHVHRITNRWGFVKAKTPNDTEAALRRKLPEQYWIPINDWLVLFGQKICKPISPFCSKCPVIQTCARQGVRKSR